MIGVMARDQSHHLAGYLVWLKAQSRGKRMVRGQRFAIFLIVVPFAAFGLITLHQQASLAAHFAVEELHPIGFSVLGPLCKPLARAEEPIIIANLKRNANLGGPTSHHICDPPFSGLGRNDAIRLMQGDGAGQLSAKGSAIGRIVEGNIVNLKTLLPKGLCKVAHGRKDQDNLLLMMGDIAGLLLDLGHKNDVMGRIDPIKGA